MFIAIVGSRACSSSESRVAYDWAYGLAKTGHIVVSGLAQGIDTAALLGAAAAKAQSVTILPTSIMEGIYPSSAQPLAKQLLGYGGVILSPYPNPSQGAWQLKRRLIERNFLTALWCDLCVIVSDTPEISGGTAWMLYFCNMLGKTVLRLDSNYSLHLYVTCANRKVNWIPELKALEEHIRSIQQ